MKNARSLPHKSGIYKITNLINGHSYIGQAKDIYDRYNRHHKYDYKSEKVQTYPLYQAFNKYGLDKFQIEVIELCDEKDLDQREIYWIKYYDTFNNGYNATKGGQFWSPKVHSLEVELKRQETREKNKSLQAENHPRAKLTNEEVLQIRKRYIEGENISSIYKDYQMLYNNEGTFKRIVLGETYKSVGNIPTKQDIRYTNAVLNTKQVIEMRKKYYLQNKGLTELANEYKMSISSVEAIVKRETYKHIKDDIPDQRPRKTYRLTPDEVREMRKEYKEGKTTSHLMNKYHIGKTAVLRCVQYKTYTNID